MGRPAAPPPPPAFFACLLLLCQGGEHFRVDAKRWKGVISSGLFNGAQLSGTCTVSIEGHHVTLTVASNNCVDSIHMRVDRGAIPLILTAPAFFFFCCDARELKRYTFSTLVVPNAAGGIFRPWGKGGPGVYSRRA